MDSKRLFRKIALERMSSPEQLDQLLQVTTPRNWLALLALVGLLAAVVAWGFAGELRTVVTGQGSLVYLSDRGSTVDSASGPVGVRTANQAARLGAVLFVPLARAAEIHPKMAVEIVLATVRREEFGFIRGRVASVTSDQPNDPRPVSDQRHPVPALSRQEEAPLATVMVDLEVDAASPSGYRWSSGPGPSIPLGASTPCLGDVVVRTERPIGLVFPALTRRPLVH
jgi:hypothetical protein